MVTRYIYLLVYTVWLWFPYVWNGSLIPDIMHDVLEGVLQYEVKLMLQHMITIENYFTLDMFNTKLENLELSTAESNNRPTSISLKNINSERNSLKQNGQCHFLYAIFRFVFILLASQMWLLGRILPLVIGEHIPEDEERWLLFLHLMNIVNLLRCGNLQ